MTFSIKPFFFFFFYVFALFSTQINARDSYTFGKFQRQNPQNQNPSFIPDSESGYGLYGHDNEEFNNEDSFDPSLSQTQESYENYPKTTEREGMSDTRFMENGKYYFDVNDERKHGSFYRKHGSDYKYNPTSTGYYENEKSFKNPYNSWSENNQQSQMFGHEEQRDEFTP